MQIIINAGGTGSRLWPLSTSKTPKQFVNLIDDEQNFVQKTIQRLQNSFEIEQIWLSTNQKFEKLAINSLPQNFVKNQLLLECEKRDTFASIIAQTAVLASLTSRTETLIFVASDHLIGQKDWNQFNSGLLEMAKTLESGDFELVIAGIKPNFANTELGYIELGNQIEKTKNSTGNLEKKHLEKINSETSDSKTSELCKNNNSEILKNSQKTENKIENNSGNLENQNSRFGQLESYKVARFREKPDLETAEKFVESGNFLWNLGYFAINYEILLRIIQKHWSELVPILEKIYQTGQITPEIYAQIPKNSIDFALVEKLDKIASVKMEIGWKDIGNWNILSEFLPETLSLKNGKLLEIETENGLENNLEEGFENDLEPLNNSQNKVENGEKVGQKTESAIDLEINKNKEKNQKPNLEVNSDLNNNLERNSEENLQNKLAKKVNSNSKNVEISKTSTQNLTKLNPKHLQIKGKNNKIKSQNGKNIVIIGASDLVVIESDSGILIMNKNEIKLVKDAANYFENL